MNINEPKAELSAVVAHQTGLETTDNFGSGELLYEENKKKNTHNKNMKF